MRISCTKQALLDFREDFAKALVIIFNPLGCLDVVRYLPRGSLKAFLLFGFRQRLLLWLVEFGLDSYGATIQKDAESYQIAFCTFFALAT